MKNEIKEEVVRRYSSRIEGGQGCCGDESGHGCGSGSHANQETSMDAFSGNDSCCDSSANEELRRLTVKLGSPSFGCGNPVGLSSVEEGDIVVDLGSGAGLDCIMAAQRTGETGRVFGIDLSDAMIARATENAREMNLEDRVRFLKGDIEDIPLQNDSATLVISNCVIALAPDKKRVFSEIFRVLRPGGRFVISDVVSEEEIPGELARDINLYASCVTGAAQLDSYLDLIRKAGFVRIEEVERSTYGRLENGNSSIGMLSVTIRGYK